MKDYGTTRCPEADKFIDDHKLAWKEQAERSKILGNVEDTSEYEDLGRGNSSDEDEDIAEDTGMSRDIDMLGDDPAHLRNVPTMDNAGRMENSATNADYHESCRLLYATPSAESDLEPSQYRDPILIRAEYSRIYDRLMFLHGSQECKAVVTGQPGIGNHPCTVSYVVNMTN
jgi:hypothetical protein